MEEGEGISRWTCMYNPWTQTIVWWWPEGRGSRGWEEGGKVEGNEDNYNSVKNREKKYHFRRHAMVFPYPISEAYSLLVFASSFPYTLNAVNTKLLPISQRSTLEPLHSHSFYSYYSLSLSSSVFSLELLSWSAKTVNVRCPSYSLVPRAFITQITLKCCSCLPPSPQRDPEGRTHYQWPLWRLVLNVGSHTCL